eukprot:TRINITY_DN6025_c3_g2_i1.p1 TRINITY_DN6025_c3_g2~~TRINITY_DN6025_c3_g2_i1.p1  ORF type:complete len:208 (-),score=38.19 TRINITY_DN6025_c3_g2_i1:651-1274(-)
MAASMAFSSSATINHSLTSSSFSQCFKLDSNVNSAARLHLHNSLAGTLKRCMAVSLKKDDMPNRATVSQKGERVTRQGSSETRLLSVSALPLFLAATEVYWKPFETSMSSFTPEESSLKALYMVLSCAFCWGCVVFASMNDEFYEGDEYRNAGGNGTQYWMYEKEEEKEEEAREELWREELRREIEGRVSEVKEIEGPSIEKEKELV